MSDLNLLCPSCNRDFEVPRRYKTRAEDYDFKPLPRIMACLHTVCHSCLEDQRQRNGNGLVVCPICRTEDVIKGVDYLPLDISIMKEIIRVNSAQSVAMCSRCYDDTPSFSWCFSCSCALCEFHHQDHILSADTSRNHKVMTFREIRHQNVHIDYRFPPVACPEVLMQDCSIFCHDCLHLVSAQGMIENHKGHQVDEYKETIPSMVETVQESLEQSRSNCSLLQQQIDETQELLQQLDENEESSAAEINRVFHMLKRKLAHREKEILERLGQIVEDKRQILTSQLNTLTEMLDDNNNAAFLADGLLQDTDTEAKDPDSCDRMYVVAATEAVEFRTDTLTELMEQKLKELTRVSADVSVHFVADEALAFKALAKSFGGVVYRVDKPPSSATELFDVQDAHEDDRKNKNNGHIDSGEHKSSMHSKSNSNSSVDKPLIDYGPSASLRAIDSEERLHKGLNGGDVASTYSLAAAAAITAAPDGSVGPEVVSAANSAANSGVNSGQNSGQNSAVSIGSAVPEAAADAAAEDEQPLPKIRFCVRVKRDPVAAKGSKAKLLPHSHEFLVVEARWVDDDGGDDNNLLQNNATNIQPATQQQQQQQEQRHSSVKLGGAPQSKVTFANVPSHNKTDENDDSISTLPPPQQQQLQHQKQEQQQQQQQHGDSVKPPAANRARLRKEFSVKRHRAESATKTNPATGILLGSVVVHTDIDRRLLNRHQLHSYFESMRDSQGLPVMKVIKELVPAATTSASPLPLPQQRQLQPADGYSNEHQHQQQREQEYID